MAITREQIIERLEELYAQNVDIAKAKNADYASTADPFKNFRACEVYGIKAEHGLITRMSDKLARISNLLEKQASVSDEAITDTLSDLANYAMLTRIFLENKHTL